MCVHQQHLSSLTFTVAANVLALMLSTCCETAFGGVQMNDNHTHIMKATTAQVQCLGIQKYIERTIMSIATDVWLSTSYGIGNSLTITWGTMLWKKGYTEYGPLGESMDRSMPFLT